jgi:hypothetical protein
MEEVSGCSLGCWVVLFYGSLGGSDTKLIEPNCTKLD